MMGSTAIVRRAAGTAWCAGLTLLGIWFLWRLVSEGDAALTWIGVVAAVLPDPLQALPRQGNAGERGHRRRVRAASDALRGRHDDRRSARRARARVPPVRARAPPPLPLDDQSSAPARLAAGGTRATRRDAPS